MKFERVQVPGDGNCLFSCIGIHVQKPQNVIRKVICRTLRDRWTELPIDLQQLGDDGRPLNQFHYVQKMKEDKMWGGVREVYAASIAFGFTIRICNPTANGFRFMEAISGSWIQENNRECHLLFDSNSLHYTYLRTQNSSPERTFESSPDGADETSNASSLYSDDGDEVEIPRRALCDDEVSSTKWLSQDVAETYAEAYTKHKSALVTQEEDEYVTLQRVANAVAIKPGFVFVIDDNERNLAKVRGVSKHVLFYTDITEVLPVIDQNIAIINIERTIMFDYLGDFISGLFAVFTRRLTHPDGTVLYISVCVKPSPTTRILMEKTGKLGSTKADATDVVKSIVDMAKKHNVVLFAQENSCNFKNSTSGILTSTMRCETSYSTKVHVKCRFRSQVGK